MNKITLEFTSQELDLIASVLAEQPWKVSNALLVNIQKQITSQQQERTHVQPNAAESDAAGPSDGRALRAA